MENASVTHILIIWSSANYFINHIVSDLKKEFRIRNRFTCRWEPYSFKDNLRSFYAHSQKHLSDSKYSDLLDNKMLHCGTDEFYVIVFEDDNPNIDIRETSNGKRLVNAHVFDKKIEYRKLTGGGHKIHCSDDDWETNKDLTLLFGCNTYDFYCKYSADPYSIANYSCNCLGVNGFESIERLFYLLNNSISYCVLRNYECLPDDYIVEGHGDIDLLVEDLNYIRYLTGAKKIYPENYRVYHTIRIGDIEVPFDFRFIGDNYYDRPWEKDILDNRQLTKNLFYVPDNENLYFSLLYHAFIQKWEVKPDYLPKLREYGNRIGVLFSAKVEEAVNQLDDFIRSRRYEYIKPTDNSVVYNTENLALSKYAMRYGTFVKRVSESGNNGYVYESLVYEKTDSFIKRGTDWIIANEYKYLKRLEKYKFFPKVVDYHRDEENDNLWFLEITRLRGVTVPVFFNNVNHQYSRYIKSFIKGSLNILEILNKESIIHRDYLPLNLIVSERGRRKVEVGLIDFGWAIDRREQSPKTPAFLGGHYAPDSGYSDLYSFGSVLIEFWSGLSFVHQIAVLLQNDNPVNSSLVVLNKCRQLLRICISPKDELKLLIRRHQTLQYLKRVLTK